jgi:hypothetical protein
VDDEDPDPAAAEVEAEPPVAAPLPVAASLLEPASVLVGLASLADTGRRAPAAELEGRVMPPEADVPTAVVNPGPLALGMRRGGDGTTAVAETACV